MQNRQDIVLPICSLELGEWVYVTTGCGKNVFRVSKISGNLHFEIRHYAMPCHGGTIENFWNGHTTTYLPVCNGTKSHFKSESHTLVLAHTNWPPSSMFLVLVAQICVLLVWSLNSDLKKFIQLQICNPIATRPW